MSNALDYSALFAALPSEEQYLSRDPLYSAGANIGRLPQQQYDNPWASFLMPVGQGLASGALMNYGREHAMDTAHNDYIQMRSQIPDADFQADPYSTPEDVRGSILAEALKEGRPEDWTIQQGRGDLISRSIAAEAVREKELQSAKIRDELLKTLQGKGMTIDEDGQLVPLGNYAKIEADAAAMKKKAELGAEGPGKIVDKIPAAMFEKFGGSKAVIDEARVIAKNIDGLKTSWTELQAGKRVSGFDKEELNASILNVVDVLGKNRSGASLNSTEEKTYNEILNLMDEISSKRLKSRLSTSKLGLVEAAATKGIAGMKEAFAPVAETVPPGMKLQRNKKTGQTRLVPL